MATESVICIDELTIRYGAFVAVDRLNLQIRKGELFGLLGPNGAGKSSTIKTLIGQQRPTGGRVAIFGHDIVREWSSIKPKFGYVPDRENHFDEFTGRRNLQIFAGLYGTSVNRIDQVLAMVELDEASDRLVKNYSLGMRKKLLLARAILHQPSLLYLDEPTANLDVHSASVVYRILNQLLAAGTTIVLTTHNMVEVQKLCDRVAILCRGKLIALDTPLALRSQHYERRADVILIDNTKLIVNLDDHTDREKLASFVASGAVASMQTREFDFHSAFLKLTGTEFE